MNWFGKIEGEGGLKGYIKVGKGNVLIVQKAFGRVSRRRGVKDARGFLIGIKRLLPFFALQGYLGHKASEDGKTIFVNQRAVKPLDLSHLQLFSIFASVELATGKVYDDTIIRHVDIMEAVSDSGLQFRCDDPEVVFEVLWHIAKLVLQKDGSVYACDTENYDQIVDRFAEALRKHEQLITTIMKEAA